MNPPHSQRRNQRNQRWLQVLSQMKGHQKIEYSTSLRASKAQMNTVVVTGITVNAPMARGRPTRLRRCTASCRSPLLCHSSAVKKPLSRKNTGILNPWMAKNSSV